MAQLTFYLPNNLEDALRERAAQSGKSLSAFIADLVRREVDPDVWSEAFVNAYGAWEEEIEEPPDPPPEERDSW